MMLNEAVISHTTKQDGLKFPVWLIQQGRHYTGLSILDKPHPHKQLMTHIVEDVMHNERLYQPLISRYAKKYALNDVLDALEILLIAGVIQIESKNLRPKTQLEWQPRRIFLDPRTQLALSNTESIKKDEIDASTEAAEILVNIDNRLARLVRSFIQSSQTVDANGAVVATPNAPVKYRSILLALAWSARLIHSGQREPLRVVSQRVWGDSKRLDAYKADIIAAGHDTMDNLHLTAAYEITLAYGDVEYTINGRRTSFLAGVPVAVTEETIQEITAIDSNIDKILIIENIAVFREILRRHYRPKGNVLLLWGEGFLSSTKKMLLQKVIESSRAPVFVWSDIDASGLQIVCDIRRFCAPYAIDVIPVLMSEEELALSAGKFEGADHTMLPDPEIDVVFPGVAPLVRQGNTMEQEELIIHYETIKDRLP